MQPWTTLSRRLWVAEAAAPASLSSNNPSRVTPAGHAAAIQPAQAISPFSTAAAAACCTHAAAAASCSAPACILVLQCPGCGRQLPAGWLLMQQRCANSTACAVQQQHKQGLSTTHDPAAERGYAAATEAAAAGQHCTAPSSWHCAAAVVVLGWILEYRQGCFTCSLVASQV